MSFFLSFAVAALNLWTPQFSPLVHAAAYRSESGRYAFEVDPSDRFGQGFMQCRLLRGTLEVWSTTLPWTAEGAGVANDGTIVAYSNHKCLRIAVYERSSALLALHELPHRLYPIHGRPLPCARGEVLVHDDAGVAHVPVADGQIGPRWITIRLSTGECVEDARPASEILLRNEQRTREREAIAAPSALELLQLERLGVRSLRTPNDKGVEIRRDVEPNDADEPRTYSTNFMFDRFGRVLIRERDSQSVQVFDVDGEPLFRCRIEPEERIEGWVARRSLRVTHDKSVWTWVRDGVVQFDSEGRRIAKHLDHDDRSSRGRLAQWRQMSKYDSEERWLRSICRRPDNRWIARLLDCCMLADGRALLLERLDPFAAGRSALHVYGADGEPHSTLSFSTHNDTLSVAGPWILVGRDFAADCLVVRCEDRKLFQFTFPPDLRIHSVPGLSADGKELLLLQYDSLEITRFALP